MLALMAENFHEDPPLYDIVLGVWMSIAGYEQVLLRGMSVVFWLVALLGIWAVARQMGGPRSGAFAICVGAAMPVHMLFPCAMRWYSLFAALSIWNFYLYLRAAETPSQRSRSCLFAGYAVIGVAMWYTNYAAPAVFLGHGLVALAFWRRLVPPLIAAWVAIGAVYLPWITVFLRQLSLEDPPAPVQEMAAAMYAMVAGELSTPFAWHVSLPAVVLGLLTVGLVLSRWRECGPAAMMVVVLLGVLLVSRVLIPKRIMIVTPYLAVAIGVAFDRQSADADWLRLWLKRGWLACAMLVLGGSMVNFVSREGWLSYRWLVPYEEVVSRALREIDSSRNGVAFTNSNAACFYAHDPVGLNIAARFPERLAQMRLVPIGKAGNPLSQSFLGPKLESAEWAVYIHENASTPYSRISTWLEDELAVYGFTLEGVELYTPLPSTYVSWHPDAQRVPSRNDMCRLLVCKFRRRAN
jgi:hypothetical protein